MIYVCSLEPNRYENVHGISNNLHMHKNGKERSKAPILHKMKAKHELRDLKPYINVVLLCIQHLLEVAHRVMIAYNLRFSNVVD